MSDAERAFALGHLVHAAAYVFAHTYVNRYAGDVFDIQTNEGAARRHVRVESFISRAGFSATTVAQPRRVGSTEFWDIAGLQLVPLQEDTHSGCEMA
jgi:hypothetical protein